MFWVCEPFTRVMLSIQALYCLRLLKECWQQDGKIQFFCDDVFKCSLCQGLRNVFVYFFTAQEEGTLR